VSDAYDEGWEAGLREGAKRAHASSAGVRSQKDVEYQAMLENLTACQTRCTELLEENRKLRGIGGTTPLVDMLARKQFVVEQQARCLGRILAALAKLKEEL
jgi:hypothetical protein